MPTPARGQVARGTFSGPRSRGTRWGLRSAAHSTPAKRANSQDTANGASDRTPSHLPRHPRWQANRCHANDRCTGRWWCPRAEAPFAVSWLVARLDGDDAAERRGPQGCPASVGRSTGAPPSPWVGHSRRQAGLARTAGFRSKPPVSGPRAEAGMRAAANDSKGPNAISAPLQVSQFHPGSECENSSSQRSSHPHSPRYAARTFGSLSKVLAAPLIVISPESIT